MGVEPEQVLEEDDIAAFKRIKKAHPHQPLEHDELEGEADQLGSCELEDGCR